MTAGRLPYPVRSEAPPGHLRPPSVIPVGANPWRKKFRGPSIRPTGPSSHRGGGLRQDPAAALGHGRRDNPQTEELRGEVPAVLVLDGSPEPFMKPLMPTGWMHGLPVITKGCRQCVRQPYPEGRIADCSAFHCHPVGKPAASLGGLIRRLRSPACRGAPQGLGREASNA
jgi:hypothetical protein